MSVESCRHTERTAKWIHIFLSSLNEDLIFVVFKLKLRSRKLALLLMYLGCPGHQNKICRL